MEIASMELLVAARTDDRGKFAAVIEAVSDAWRTTVLDVGARRGAFGEMLMNRCERYCGLDLGLPTDVVADADRGLPFRDMVWDTVVALDVLEHLENIHQAFDELCRVARRDVIVALPNMYEAGIRLRFLRGQPISGKYGLPASASKDRHRWVFSLTEGRRFLTDRARSNGFRIERELCLVGPRRGRRFGRLSLRWPDLLVPTYVTHLRRFDG